MLRLAIAQSRFDDSAVTSTFTRSFFLVLLCNSAQAESYNPGLDSVEFPEDKPTLPLGLGLGLGSTFGTFGSIGQEQYTPRQKVSKQPAMPASIIGEKLPQNIPDLHAGRQKAEMTARSFHESENEEIYLKNPLHKESSEDAQYRTHVEKLKQEAHAAMTNDTTLKASFTTEAKHILAATRRLERRGNAITILPRSRAPPVESISSGWENPSRLMRAAKDTAALPQISQEIRKDPLYYGCDDFSGYYVTRENETLNVQQHGCDIRILIQNHSLHLDQTESNATGWVVNDTIILSETNQKSNTAPVGHNCNCGTRLTHFAAGEKTRQTCKDECNKNPLCKSYGFWTGGSPGLCALWDRKCSCHGHCSGPGPTHAEDGWTNDVYNKDEAFCKSFPSCKTHNGSVWVFCGSSPFKRWNKGAHSEAKAIRKCNHAAQVQKKWGECIIGKTPNSSDIPDPQPRKLGHVLIKWKNGDVWRRKMCNDYGGIYWDGGTRLHIIQDMCGGKIINTRDPSQPSFNVSIIGNEITITRLTRDRMQVMRGEPGTLEKKIGHLSRNLLRIYFNGGTDKEYHNIWLRNSSTERPEDHADAGIILDSGEERDVNDPHAAERQAVESKRAHAGQLRNAGHGDVPSAVTD